jgi:uncharacterized protein (DUF608 family)
LPAIACAAAQYHELFARRQAGYIKKLWNGEYFRYDTQSETKGCWFRGWFWGQLARELKSDMQTESISEVMKQGIEWMGIKRVPMELRARLVRDILR